MNPIYSPASDRYENGMRYRRSGRSGVLLPEISLGLWHNFGDVNPLSHSLAMAHYAFDHGITHFDLANNYGPSYGSAEETFGFIEIDESFPSVVPTAVAAGKDASGFRRKKLTLPDFERTFFAPTDCRNRSAIYVSAPTKGKVSAILHLLGDDSTRLTALVDNMLRFVMSIYSDELNYLHEKNSRRPF